MIFQSKAQVLGRAGERWFQSILPREWIFQKPEEDIGIDGKITIGTSEKTGSLEFAVQIKASKTWDIKENVITVDGIKTDTISYWGSRLYPTLLVLFDDDKNLGYYSWVFDIINHPLEFALPEIKQKQKTVSLKLKATSVLDKQAFNTVRLNVEQYYLKFTSEFRQLKKTVNILPTVNDLSQALRGLYHTHIHKPATQDEQMLCGITMFTSHREIIRTLDRLQKQYQLEINTNNFVQFFIASYTNEVSKIIHDFDKVVFEDKNLAVWISDENHQKITPRLIDLILELMVILSDREPKKHPSLFKPI